MNPSIRLSIGLVLSSLVLSACGSESSDPLQFLADAEASFEQATSNDDYLAVAKELEGFMKTEAVKEDTFLSFRSDFLRLRCKAKAGEKELDVAFGEAIKQHGKLLKPNHFEIFCVDLADAGNVTTGVTLLGEATKKFPDLKSQFQKTVDYLLTKGADPKALKDLGYL